MKLLGCYLLPGGCGLLSCCSEPWVMEEEVRPESVPSATQAASQGQEPLLTLVTSPAKGDVHPCCFPAGSSNSERCAKWWHAVDDTVCIFEWQPYASHRLSKHWWHRDYTGSAGNTPPFSSEWSLGISHQVTFCLVISQGMCMERKRRVFVKIAGYLPEERLTRTCMCFWPGFHTCCHLHLYALVSTRAGLRRAGLSPHGTVTADSVVVGTMRRRSVGGEFWVAISPTYTLFTALEVPLQ